MLYAFARPAALLLAAAAFAAPALAEDGGDKLLPGMSVVGDDEAPKSLVIVPWKSSPLGDEIDFSKVLDDGRRPVDRDVFRRQLSYYELRSASREEGTPPAE